MRDAWLGVCWLPRDMRGSGRRWLCPWLAGLLLACEPDALTPLGPACGTTVVRGEAASLGRDALDLLLVVSDAPSMAQEQSALARELPALAHALATGVIGGGEEHEPQRDVRIAVVSADLGVDAEPRVPGCSATGRDAFLQLGGASRAACGPQPAFVSYRVPTPERHRLIAPPDRAPEDAFARELACRGALGSAGCGVVQPLEAALRALRRDEAGFQRNDAVAGLSFLQVVVVSDSDDCSLKQPDAFAQAVHGAALAPASACAERPELLYTVDGYVRALRAQRLDQEFLVGFAVITGVPEDFVPSASGFVQGARAAQLAALLADPRMQPSTGPDGALRPVCQNAQASATPAPRLVAAAMAFGEDAAVISICSPDWTRALAPVFGSIAFQSLGQLCLPRKPVRNADGLTQCEVLWELPRREDAREGTPSACSERAFLRERAARPRTDDGRAVCEVAQRAVTGLPDAPQLEPGEGWFYDDFSPIGRDCFCRGPSCNAIYFVPNAAPPGVVIRVECFESHCLSRDGGPCEPAQCRVP